MKGLIFKRDLGLISGIYISKRNDLRWKEMPYIEGIRSPLFDIPVECTKRLRGHTHAPDFDQWCGRIPRRHPHFSRPFIHFTHEEDITAKECTPQKAWFWNLFMHCSPFSGQSGDMYINNHILKGKVFSFTWYTTTVVDVGCNKFRHQLLLIKGC